MEGREGVFSPTFEMSRLVLKVFILGGAKKLDEIRNPKMMKGNTQFLLVKQKTPF